MSDGTLQTLDVSMLDDVGTGANQLIQLDSNAKIPACSGAAITGLSSVTKNASDPVIATNPSGGVGTVWQNTTSGEMYICTDATAGANVWINVGAGSGDIIPIPPYGGEAYGFGAGGQILTTGGSAPHYYITNVIERFSFTSDGDATDWADLVRSTKYSSGATSQTYGYTCMGSYAAPSATDHNVIQKYAMSSQSNSTDIGDALAAGSGSCGSSSQTHGYASGRYVAPAPYSDQIQKWSFSTDGNATDVGNLLVGLNTPAGHSDWVGNYGWVSGGQPSTNVIQKFAFATDGDSTDVANMTTNKNAHHGTSSATYGYCSAGHIPPNCSNIIEKFSFANGTDATDVGDLVYGVYLSGNTGQSSTTNGYLCTGAYGPSEYTNWIQKYSFTTDGNATDIGDLTESKYSTHASHY